MALISWTPVSCIPEDLRLRAVAEDRSAAAMNTNPRARPFRTLLWGLAVLALVAIVAGSVVGWLP